MAYQEKMVLMDKLAMMDYKVDLVTQAEMVKMGIQE